MYLLAIGAYPVGMPSSPKNMGERSEVFLKAFLTKCLFDGIELEGAPDEIRCIKTMNYGPGINAPSWSDAMNEMLNNKDYEKLKIIFGKAKPSFKADIFINDVSYSIKYEGAARPAIVNHTNRKGFLRVCRRTGQDINTLDGIIDEYWDLRISGKIKEDVKNSDPLSPFANHKDYLSWILRYFIFKGTAKGTSAFPADKVLSFQNPEDPSTYRILSEHETIDEIWDHLVFSLRSKKGMPTKRLPDGSLINTYDETKYTELAPWVRYFPKDDAFPRGSLHVRV